MIGAVERTALIAPGSNPGSGTSARWVEFVCRKEISMKRILSRLVVCLVAVVLLAAGSLADDNAIAQRKADQQAREGRMRHVGGSFGTGRYEGVGFSTRSSTDAIHHCCYWGQRTPVGIGVARGTRGWYATVLYR